MALIHIDRQTGAAMSKHAMALRVSEVAGTCRNADDAWSEVLDTQVLQCS